MDPNLKIALVGYGRFGKKYYKTLKKLNLSDKTIIFKKHDKKKYIKISSENLKKKKIHLGIIVTPPNTHYKIATLFLKNKIPFILEKPAAMNSLQVKNIKKLSLKNKTSVIVNYSDLFNNNFIKLYESEKNLRNYVTGKFLFGKFNGNYTNLSFLPYFDWFPHILATYFYIFKKIKKKKIITYNFFKKQNNYFEEISMNLYFDDDKFINIKFSNLSKKKRRIIRLKTLYNLYNYDGNNIKNNFLQKNKRKKYYKDVKKTMDNIIYKLIDTYKTKKYYSNLDLSIKIHSFLDNLKKDLRYLRKKRRDGRVV
tara:strand:- start:21 stop:950 length:930 start_codon:yes stop_codon:yes gene_type:complete